MIRREGDKEIPEPFSDEVSGELQVKSFIIIWYAVSDILWLKSFSTGKVFHRESPVAKRGQNHFGGFVLMLNSFF